MSQVRSFSEQGRVWVHVELSPRWVAAYRLIPQGARAVVAEVRIFPAATEADERGGRWSERTGEVPAGGVPARLVKERVRFSDALRARHSSMRQIAGRGAGVIPLALLVEGAEWAPQWLRALREETGLTREEHLAVVAAAYCEALAAGVRQTNVEVARTLGLSPTQVRDRIREAREEGLLTGAPKKGVPGGRLRPRARRILRPVRSRQGGGEARHAAR